MASNEELMNKIASLRNGREYGDKSMRPFSAPKLNWSATSIRNIKDWSDVTEPLITTSISTQELMQFPSPNPKMIWPKLTLQPWTLPFLGSGPKGAMPYTTEGNLSLHPHVPPVRL